MIEIAQKDNPFFEEGYKYEEIQLKDFKEFKSLSDLNFSNRLELNKISKKEDLEKIKSIYKEGDIIYSYESPDWTWHSLCGRSGIKIIRNDEEIYNRICVMS